MKNYTAWQSYLQNLLSILTIFFVIFTFSTPVFARSLDEIQADINQKASQLDNLNKVLENAESELYSKKQTENSAQGEVAKLTAEIESIEAALKYNQLRIEQLEEQKLLKELEIEENEEKQNLQVQDSYKSWKSKDFKNSFFGGSDFVRNTIYNQAITTKSHGGILGLAIELNDLNEEYDGFLSDSKSLQKEMEELDKKRAHAQTKLDEIRQQVAAASNDVSKIRTQASALQSQIDQLTQEQKDAQAAEDVLVRGGSGGATKPLVPGEYYFTGVGRDLYQGHGVGMSQYGALGAALSGWDYKKILKFYFPGTTVDASLSKPSHINVDGHGSIPTEDYVAGAGEVPDYACEDLGVNFDPGNFWGCWPREAIKAQVVAFRTYGVRRAGFVYSDTRGQVYKGGNAKQWAADATKGVTVNYGGGFADVYYSSDNNQGKGNANNDTVWSNYSGDGTVIPYLRSVNDNSFAYKSKWTSWGWRTNSYEISEINDMLSWSSSGQSYSNFISGVKSDIGTLQSLNFERDPSDRVNKVVLQGSKGSRKIAGWLFKSMWNIWVGNVKPSGEADYIYSLTYFFKRV